MLSPFLAEVMEPQKGTISPQRLSSVLHISLVRLSQLTQLHRNTLTRHPDSPDVQQRLGDVARIISQAAELAGDQQRAIIWFRLRILTTSAPDSHQLRQVILSNFGRWIPSC